MGAFLVATRRQWIAFFLALALAFLIEHRVGADERVKARLVTTVEAPAPPPASRSLMFQPTCGEDTWRELCGDWWDWCQFFGAYCPA